MMGWQWHQLNHMQIICTSLQTHNHANTSSLNFYKPDALPDAQPTCVKAPKAENTNFKKLIKSTSKSNFGNIVI